MTRSKNWTVFTAVLTAAFLVTAGAATTSAGVGGNGDKPPVCHPVEGEGETGYGWNIIPPDQASSHIDEETGIGFHTRSDGSTDVYAVNGVCPGGPTTTTTTSTTSTTTTTSTTLAPTTTTTSTTLAPTTTTTSTTLAPTTTSTTLAPITTTTEPTTTQPTVPPTEPTVPPTQPTVPPTEPTVPPTQPTVPPTTVPTDVLPWEETTSVPATLAPPLGRIPETGSSAIAPISVIAGSMLLSGALAVAATRRRPIR